MSYWCHATDEVVIGEARELVPVRIRKVTYVGQTKPDAKSNFLQFAGQTEGWEILEEVSVRKSKAEEYKAVHAPIVCEEKEVRFMKPRKPKEKVIRQQDDEDDKPEDSQ